MKARRLLPRGQNGTHQAERKWTRRNNFLTPSLLPSATLHSPPHHRPFRRHPILPVATEILTPQRLTNLPNRFTVEMNLRNISKATLSLTLLYITCLPYIHPLELASRPILQALDRVWSRSVTKPLSFTGYGPLGGFRGGLAMFRISRVF